MSPTWEKLKKLFIEDHRMMTRSYRDLLQHLENDELGKAAELAAKLDQQAGAHVEFEEQHLYPRVRESRGDKYADQMYQEHREILNTLVELQQIQSTVEPSKRQIQRWKTGVQNGINHAVACGTLLSHLQTLPESTQADLLQFIEQLRRKSKKWSSLRTK